jgi:hypothetical protein
MAACVRQAEYNVVDGRATLLPGPAARLETETAIALARASRAFRQPAASRGQADTPQTIATAGPLWQPLLTIAEGDAGIPTRLMLTHSDGQSITLDAEDVANIDPESEDTPALSIETIWEVVPEFDEGGDLTNLAFRQRQAVVGTPGTDTDVAVTDCSGA